MANKKINRMCSPTIVKRLAKRLEINQDVSASVIYALIEVLVDGIEEYDAINFFNFLTIEKSETNARVIELNGEKIQSDPYVKLYVKPTKIFKKLGLNGKYPVEVKEKIMNRYSK